MFKNYSKLHGLPYLFSVLANLLVSLEHETNVASLKIEVDPNKLEEGEDSISNKVRSFIIYMKNT